MNGRVRAANRALQQKVSLQVGVNPCQPGEDAMRVDQVLHADNHPVRRAGWNDVCLQSPQFLLGRFHGVAGVVHVVHEDHVRALALDQQPANLGV